jgi:hypothetical protein
MLATRWKVLILSLAAYQVLLTWCMFELVNISAYFSSLECGEWCDRRPFGFILRNQGAYETAWTLVWLTVILVLVNAATWLGSIWNRRHPKP